MSLTHAVGLGRMTGYPFLFKTSTSDGISFYFFFFFFFFASALSMFCFVFDMGIIFVALYKSTL